MSRVTVWKDGAAMSCDVIVRLEECVIKECVTEGKRQAAQAKRGGWTHAYDNQRGSEINHILGCVAEKACGKYLGLEPDWAGPVGGYDLPLKIECRTRVPNSRYREPDLVVGIPRDLKKLDSPYILSYTPEDLKPTTIIGWMRMEHIIKFFPRRTSPPLSGYNVVPPHRLHRIQILRERVKHGSTRYLLPLHDELPHPAQKRGPRSEG